jgi:hypothetical protein
MDGSVNWEHTEAGSIHRQLSRATKTGDMDSPADFGGIVCASKTARIQL